MSEYKKFDSNHTLEVRYARLTADAKVINPTFVKVTTALESKAENDETIWLEMVPIEAQAEMAAYLKKGDVIGATGFLTLQRWGDNNDKTTHTLKFARLHYPITLLVELKERAQGKSKVAATPGKALAAGKKPARPIVNLDDDE